MKPVTRYIKTNTPVGFYTLVASAARYKEIAIGYKKSDGNGSFNIVINPLGREKMTFDDHDDFSLFLSGLHPPHGAFVHRPLQHNACGSYLHPYAPERPRPDRYRRFPDIGRYHMCFGAYGA